MIRSRRRQLLGGREPAHLNEHGRPHSALNDSSNDVARRQCRDLTFRGPTQPDCPSVTPRRARHSDLAA